MNYGTHFLAWLERVMRRVSAARVHRGRRPRPQRTALDRGRGPRLQRTALDRGRGPRLQRADANRGYGPRLQRARGSVIVIVLITILFASVALLLFIEKASTDLLVDAREANASRMRMEAYSALETTIEVLEEFRLVIGALHHPAEGWGDPLRFANYEPAPGRRVDVQFVDESAKLSLPKTEKSTFVELFKGWGIQQANAEKLTDALLGWMQKDYVPGSASAPRPEDYDRGEIPFVPPARPLRSFSELASIDYVRNVFYDENGEPNELWVRFTEAFSLYAYEKANVNGGNPHVLTGMGIIDESQHRRVHDYLTGQGAYQRQGAGYFKSTQEVASLLGGNSPAVELTTEIAALRVIVTVWEGRSSFRLNAVIAPQGGATIPVVETNESNQGTGTGSGAPATQPRNQPNSPNSPQRANARTNDGSAAKSLNYPFTILEIRENDEIPLSPNETAL